VPKNSATRLIEQEIAKDTVAGDEAGLLPQAVARRRRDAADDDVADLPLRVTRDDVDNFGRAHCGDTGRSFDSG
jgi:hypothetical protein